MVVEAHQYSIDCPHCHHQETAAYPDGMEPERVFGAGIESLATYLHQEQHVSYARLERMLDEVFGLTVSPGALVNMVRRGASRLEPEAEKIRDQIRQSTVVGSDETGARVDGRNWWQWVFRTEHRPGSGTPQACYHVIVLSRGSQVIETVMGDAEPEVWVSDLWSAQLKHPAQQHQVCIPHQLRDLQYAIDTDRCAFAYQMQQLFLRAQRLGTQRDSLSVQQYQQQVADIEAKCDLLLQQPVPSKDGARLQRRYHKHRACLFVFIDRMCPLTTTARSETCETRSFIARSVVDSGLNGDQSPTRQQSRLSRQPRSRESQYWPLCMTRSAHRCPS